MNEMQGEARAAAAVCGRVMLAAARGTMRSRDRLQSRKKLTNYFIR